MNMKPQPQTTRPRRGENNRRTLLITGGKLGCMPRVMFDHIRLKVKDLKASKRFYTAARVRGERQAQFICA